MAESENDLTKCPVCFDEYKESGGCLPRLLPCTHTLCENCLEVLIRQTKLDCPECRLKHEAVNGVKSFPQNKYIISHLKKAKQIKVIENQEEICGTFVMCTEHKREKILFCLEDDCRKQVCIVCFARHHKQHSYVDLELQRQKCEPLLSKITSLTKDCQDQREKFMASKEDLEGKIGVIVAEMEVQKEKELKKVIEKYQKAMEEEYATSRKDIKEIEKEVAEIVQFIADLDAIKRHTNIVNITDDDITKNKEAVQKIAMQLSSKIKVFGEAKSLLATVSPGKQPSPNAATQSSSTGSAKVLPNTELQRDTPGIARMPQLKASHFKCKGQCACVCRNVFYHV